MHKFVLWNDMKLHECHSVYNFRNKQQFLLLFFVAFKYSQEPKKKILMLVDYLYLFASDCVSIMYLFIFLTMTRSKIILMNRLLVYIHYIYSLEYLKMAIFIFCCCFHTLLNWFVVYIFFDLIFFFSLDFMPHGFV